MIQNEEASINDEEIHESLVSLLKFLAVFCNDESITIMIPDSCFVEDPRAKQEPNISP